eukprot:365913-Chlamydomonas_euryale.AAC.7
MSCGHCLQCLQSAHLTIFLPPLTHSPAHTLRTPLSPHPPHQSSPLTHPPTHSPPPANCPMAQAMALAHGEIVEVACNLLDVGATPPRAVQAFVEVGGRSVARDGQGEVWGVACGAAHWQGEECGGVECDTSHSYSEDGFAYYGVGAITPFVHRSSPRSKSQDLWMPKGVNRHEPSPPPPSSAQIRTSTRKTLPLPFRSLQQKHAPPPLPLCLQQEACVPSGVLVGNGYTTGKTAAQLAVAALAALSAGHAA